MEFRPRIGLLLGDPTGIGPEVAAKLLTTTGIRQQSDVLVIGDREIYLQGLSVAQVSDPHPEFHDCSADGAAFPLGTTSAAAGEYVLTSLRRAVELLQSGKLDALVYAPLNKQALKLAGMQHDDELHYLAALLGEKNFISEINVCDDLWTSRVTSHVPLREVADLITEEKIIQSTQLLHDALAASGVSSPRIAIAALNPHAGEGGLLGTEEMTTLAPAVKRMQDMGLNVAGPVPADTLFIAARRGDYNGVVTMYHDQGQIALKLMGFDRGVTVSGGLSIPITTPAHGTAFDIAGRGVADVNPLLAAFNIAHRMVHKKQF